MVGGGGRELIAAALATLGLILFLNLLPAERCETIPMVIDSAGSRPLAVGSESPSSFGPVSSSPYGDGEPMPPPPPRSDEHAAGSPRSSYRRAPKLMAVGIITAPTHFDRRLWIRQKLRVSDARRRGIRVLFVLGVHNRMTPGQRLAIRHEENAHADVVFVGARDWVPHAVAEKSLAWWEYAAAHLQGYRWYMKTDDDSLAHLPRLEMDLAVMSAMGRSHYYYGVMTWRAWTPFHTEADAACGERGDDGPSLDGPSARLERLMLDRRPGGACSRAVGPFPFADGSLQILSEDLMHAFVDSPLARNFSRSHLSRQGPPYWTHEDAGVGYLIFHSAILQTLPLTYVVLSPWKHNKFWINWFPRNDPSLPDEHVVNTHKVVTSMMAQIAQDAYENTTYAADPFVCVDCAKKWGWRGGFETSVGRFPIERVACCNKRTDT